MSYAAALTAVALAEFLGLLHVTFGDPVVPGWIASALPLVMVYLGGFATMREAVQGMIALQFMVAMIFIAFGLAGLGHKMMRIVPRSLKGAILFGSAIAALARIFAADGYFQQYPWSVGVGSLVTLYMLFSYRFKIFKDKSRLLSQISKYGMLPGLLAAMAAGLLADEIVIPSVSWGFIPLHFGELFRGYSVFGIGLPALPVLLAAIPMALAVYIIAFGEIVTAEAVLKEAEQARPEERIDFDSNRTHLIAGVRNLILALFAPFTALAGPLWAAVTVSISERYKEGKSAMQSIYSGMGSFKLSTACCVLLLPLATLLEPILPVALAITLLLQGYACAYIAVEQVKQDKTAAGIAGVAGAAVYLVSLNMGLLVGLILSLLLENNPFGVKLKRR